MLQGFQFVLFDKIDGLECVADVGGPYQFLDPLIDDFWRKLSKDQKVHRAEVIIHYYNNEKIIVDFVPRHALGSSRWATSRVAFENRLHRAMVDALLLRVKP